MAQTSVFTPTIGLKSGVYRRVSAADVTAVARSAPHGIMHAMHRDTMYSAMPRRSTVSALTLELQQRGGWWDGSGGVGTHS